MFDHHHNCNKINYDYITQIAIGTIKTLDKSYKKFNVLQFLTLNFSDINKYSF